MKHKEMLPLMGQIVTVNVIMHRKRMEGGQRSWWVYKFCEPWAGWVTGFRYKIDGINDWTDYGNDFQETNRHLCMMVAPWPTMNGIPVPIEWPNTYTLGGKPESPNKTSTTKKTI